MPKNRKHLSQYWKVPRHDSELWICYEFFSIPLNWRQCIVMLCCTWRCGKSKWCFTKICHFFLAYLIQEQWHILVKHHLLFPYLQVQHNIRIHWRQFNSMEKNSWQINNSESCCGTFQYWQRCLRFFGILWSLYIFLPTEYGPVLFDKVLSLLISYLPRNKYSLYWWLGRFFIVRRWQFICVK